MIQKKFLTLTLLSLLTISGCSVLGTKKVEVVSKPIQLDIIQPTLPRELDLTPPQWYVVSEAVITNPCKKSLSFEPKRFDENGVEELKRPKSCDPLERENPEWPEGYTYLDRFLDEMMNMNNGEIVFVATSIGDYKVMTSNMQEIKRYIKQLGEVVVYYREVTLPNGEKGVGAEIRKDSE